LKDYSEGLEKKIEARTKELEQKTTNLEELNTALKVLLHRREEDRKDIEERFVANVKDLILPYAQKMRRTGLDEKQISYLSIIENHLNEVSSPLMRNMQQFNFTPAEAKIASLIKDGKSTKEIAEILGIAVSSVNSHRNNIRRKLDLVGREGNLQSQLRSLQ
jgi:DNA-binding CsgD family transcriptional regulator